MLGYACAARNRVCEAADLEEGLTAMQREHASEEARIVGRSRCGAVYTWGYERAFENGLDSNWAAQGWRGISFGLISPMGGMCMHLFRKRHAASGQCKNPGSLGKDAGGGVVR
jgi:hypothetical protein